VYRFEIDPAPCNDDSRSLFRLAKPNLAVITTCTGRGRSWGPPPTDELEFVSTGARAPYPPIAQSARLEGVVILELSLDANGVVTASRPLTELPLLTEAAVAHSKKWRFRPSERRHGVIVYEFSLDSRNCDSRDRTEFWRLSACSPLIER
jgi:TonB family protein